MRVIVVHKVFIGCSMFVALLLSLSRIRFYRHTGDTSALVVAVCALLLIPLMALYLKRIWNK